MRASPPRWPWRYAIASNGSLVRSALVAMLRGEPDRFVTAVAEAADLFKGSDFSQTDIAAAAY